MNKEEALSQAQEFVRGKYPIVPPITGVFHVTERPLGLEQRLFVESWLYSPDSASIISSSRTWTDHRKKQGDTSFNSFINSFLYPTFFLNRINAFHVCPCVSQGSSLKNRTQLLCTK
jgi:hypothetical protein